MPMMVLRQPSWVYKSGLKSSVHLLLKVRKSPSTADAIPKNGA
jgi:hypothetical protein